MNENFIKYLRDTAQIAKEEGFDKVELIYEDGDMEVLLYKGDTGIGSLMNDYKNDLLALTKKDVNQLKSKLNLKNISLSDYDHFGDNVTMSVVSPRSTH